MSMGLKRGERTMASDSAPFTAREWDGRAICRSPIALPCWDLLIHTGPSPRSLRSSSRRWWNRVDDRVARTSHAAHASDTAQVCDLVVVDESFLCHLFAVFIHGAHVDHAVCHGEPADVRYFHRRHASRSACCRVRRFQMSKSSFEHNLIQWESVVVVRSGNQRLW